jgi:hypothetical protein
MNQGLSRPRGLRRFAGLLALAWGLVQLSQGALADDLEAKVKAAYLFHLIKFVDWPALPPDRFRVCVQGSEAVGNLLVELSNRPIRDRPLTVEQEGDPARCQVLFIGQNEKNLPELLARSRRSGLLTVSDQAGFARRGGIVGFYKDAGKIRLEINPEAARAANLRISAKLMELARSVSATQE